MFLKNGSICSDAEKEGTLSVVAPLYKRESVVIPIIIWQRTVRQRTEFQRGSIAEFSQVTIQMDMYVNLYIRLHLKEKRIILTCSISITRTHRVKDHAERYHIRPRIRVHTRPFDRCVCATC